MSGEQHLRPGQRDPTAATEVRAIAAEVLARDPRPAPAVIEEHLRALIERGDFDRHARLPPERELAARLGVSRMTLRHALASLERDGLVVRTTGRSGGTFLAQGKVERNLSRYASVPAYLKSQGFTAGCRVISATVRPAGDVAGALSTAPEAVVYDLLRVRLADGVPISLEHAWLPADLFPGLLECPLGESISEIIESRYGRVFARAVERLEAVPAGPDEAEALGIREGAPLMSVHRTTYDPDGVIVEYAHDLFRGDRTRTVAWTLDGVSGSG
ncbi:MAG: GntR family transcriptional regulator [Solirubrobacteraceae bacterium]|jgi:GntR family transcriptional regulator|nr:GntR family transcriptional regulator [Solirubrobacteraceae bacterium]